MHPGRHLNGQGLTLLKEQDIRCGLCACILLESIVRQTHSTKQIAAFRKIAASFIVLLVHSKL